MKVQQGHSRGPSLHSPGLPLLSVTPGYEGQSIVTSSLCLVKHIRFSTPCPAEVVENNPFHVIIYRHVQETTTGMSADLDWIPTPPKKPRPTRNTSPAPYKSRTQAACLRCFRLRRCCSDIKPCSNCVHAGCDDTCYPRTHRRRARTGPSPSQDKVTCTNIAVVPGQYLEKVASGMEVAPRINGTGMDLNLNHTRFPFFGRLPSPSSTVCSWDFIRPPGDHPTVVTDDQGQMDKGDEFPSLLSWAGGLNDTFPLFPPGCLGDGQSPGDPDPRDPAFLYE